MAITVVGVVVFVGQEHHVDLRAGEALPLLRREGGDGILRGGGVARQYLYISIATRLHKTKIKTCCC